MQIITLLSLIFVCSVTGFAQIEKNKKMKDKPATVVSVSKNATPLELVRTAITAHGGDKFKLMKTLVVRGTADVSGSPTTTFPATFAMIYSGDKYRLEITNPFTPFKQVFDGQNTVSSLSGFSLPPINRLGLPLLAKAEEKDFVVSALNEKAKKKLGFRITSPEGYYTDFFIDEKTGQIKSYEASYDFNGRAITTSVEIDKVREVEGVIVPERYAQRFETGSLTIYSNFKAKEILVNSIVGDDVFKMDS